MTEGRSERRRGRPGIYRHQIIHYLALHSGPADRPTASEMEEALHCPSPSSLDTPLKILIKDGLVLLNAEGGDIKEITLKRKQKGKRRTITRGINVFSLNPARRNEIILMYFPWRGECKPEITREMRAAFLASDYVDPLFSGPGFRSLLARAFIHFMTMWDITHLQHLQRTLVDPRLRKAFNSFVKKNPNINMTASFDDAMKLIIDTLCWLIDLKNQVPGARAKYEQFFEGISKNPDDQASFIWGMSYLTNLEDPGELKELEQFARTSPSLIGSVMNINGLEGVPPIVLFDITKFLKNVSLDNPKRTEIAIRRGFERFIWDLISVRVIGDLIDYPETMTIALFRKAGLFSNLEDRNKTLAWLVDRARSDHKIESLKKRRRKDC